MKLAMAAKRDGNSVGLTGHDVELAVLDAGKIEDVVDDGQEVARAAVGQFGVLALLRGRAGTGAGVRACPDAGEGRADFVAHVGQELLLARLAPSAWRRALSRSSAARLRSLMSSKRHTTPRVGSAGSMAGRKGAPEEGAVLAAQEFSLRRTLPVASSWRRSSVAAWKLPTSA